MFVKGRVGFGQIDFFLTGYWGIFASNFTNRIRIMKKNLFFAAIALLLSVSTVFSQSNERTSVFHLSFVPPLSTNGRYAADYSNMTSFNLLAGVSKNEKAFTLGGLANIVTNDASGVQLAGLLNSVGNNGKGFMMGGLLNIVKNDFQGFQLGGLGNIAGDVRGFQFGGLFNVAKDVSGVQFAGLVNVARNSDCPIGLLNFIKNGEYGVTASYNEVGSAMLSFRSGGRITYGILGVGYNHKAKGDGFVTEAGFGAHISIAKWLRLNNEIKGASIGAFGGDKSTLHANYALLPSVKLIKNLELFGGPSINYLHTDNIENKSLFPNGSLWKKHTDTKLQQVYIGWQAGLQVVF